MNLLTQDQKKEILSRAFNYADHIREGVEDPIVVAKISSFLIEIDDILNDYTESPFVTTTNPADPDAINVCEKCKYKKNDCESKIPISQCSIFKAK